MSFFMNEVKEKIESNPYKYSYPLSAINAR